MCDDAFVSTPSPMPTEEDRKRAYAVRFKARIMKVIRDAGFTEMNAEEAANAEWEGIEDVVDLTGNPEADADESMSYWDDDG